jgi:hypothetical protein
MPASDGKFVQNLLAVVDARLPDEGQIIRNERLPAKLILRKRAKNCPGGGRAAIRITPELGGELPTA